MKRAGMYTIGAIIFLICGVFFMSNALGQAAYGQAINRIDTDQKVVALTFDDGPNQPFTNQILMILKKHAIQATFFVRGENVQKYPDVVKQTYQEGHEIGNHTWNHPRFTGKTTAFIREQIESTDTLLKEICGCTLTHFRSPYGIETTELQQVLASMKRDNILFDVVAQDWKAPESATIIERVMFQTRPGSIILLHDGVGKSEQTVPATDEIIKQLKAQGYRFVTISELLALRKKG